MSYNYGNGMNYMGQNNGMINDEFVKKFDTTRNFVFLQGRIRS